MAGKYVISGSNQKDPNALLKHSGYQDFQTSSEYGKGLDVAGLAANLKKLGVEDITKYVHRGPGAMGGSNLQNYFQSLTNQEPASPEGDQQNPPLHGFVKGGGGARAQESRQRSLDSTLKQAYDAAVQRNLYKDLDYTPEEFKANAEAHGGYEGTKDWDKWTHRENQLTGEQDWVLQRDRPTESNFYRRYKKQIIQAGAGVVGFALGGPAGAISAASLAGTLRDAYAARVDRRKVRDAQRDWKNHRDRDEAAAQAALDAKKGFIYRGAGEGVVDYATKDKTNLKKDTYVRS
jgi:hypothetical protein